MAPSCGWGVLLAVMAAGAGILAACRTGTFESTSAAANDGAGQVGEAAKVDPVGCEGGGCPAGQHCAFPPGCASLGICRDGVVSPGCTAGLVASVCGCDGAVTSSDGCPRRLAYVIGEYHGLARLAPRCDPSRRGPFSFTVQVEGDDLTAFEGHRVFWRIVPPPRQTRAQPAVAGISAAIVTDGRISWQAPAQWQHGELPLALHDLFFHVDLDGDGVCDPDEPGSRFVRPDVDLIAERLRYQLPRPSLNGNYTCEAFAAP